MGGKGGKHIHNPPAKTEFPPLANGAGAFIAALSQPILQGRIRQRIPHAQGVDLTCKKRRRRHLLQQSPRRNDQQGGMIRKAQMQTGQGGQPLRHDVTVGADAGIGIGIPRRQAQHTQIRIKKPKNPMGIIHLVFIAGNIHQQRFRGGLPSGLHNIIQGTVTVQRHGGGDLGYKSQNLSHCLRK